MDFFDVLNMIGGLALFLYGMSMMGNELSKMAGGKLEIILEKLTSKRIFAVLLGAGVTAVIQSSSATTVMIVGFVNSGIMNLNQAVGIIMGANVGTTITSWLLSLTGIEGSTIWLKMLKPSSFAPILAAIGIILVMSNKEESKKKDVGGILLGFAILMFGMETMTGAVSGLADNTSFTRMMTAFRNPILGMAVGAILTAIIQSSSASVGILQALCSTGAVHYAVALPIIMGQNAIRYNNPNGKVKISVGTIDGQVALTVKDNGIGIPVSEQQRIFERFYRVDKSRSKATGGTGLGLAIVKHIVEIHDAKIELDSAPGVGTTISVLF